MKNFTQIICMFLFAFGSISAQQEKGIVGITNWLNNWTEFNSNSVDYGEPTQILAGNITQDITLSKKYVYMLMGSVFVTNNATINIEPGTVIIGDYESKASLTISRGSKIIAEGEETDPIVFTSNRGVKRSGDWGGIIILGDAPSNKFGNGSVASYHPELKPSEYEYTNHGGDSLTSSSGILKYVRIEYAGKRIKGAGNFNGLLLASVGNQTILENIMISHSAGNSFEVLGGEVYLEKVVSYKSDKNDFKFNYGAQCQLYNSLAIRSPYVSSSDGSRSLLVKSYDEKEEVDFTKKGTSVVAQNLTFINKSEDLKSDVESGLVKEAIFIAENASLEMEKSVISGFNPAVLLDENITINQENLEKIKFINMYFNNCNGNIFTEYNSNNDDLENWYGNSAFFNVYSKGDDAETFINFDSNKRPDFRLRINKILASTDD
ncbi:hypothetical protein MWU58_11805 [Flavobacteriaceae bacterium S0825]|uniref:hypothetical protein n=1 Tax=Gaetbulibacter sp. S0825 TaxID=2720084 RepID=UPI0014309245|nr:hypothetical protein [Gaetbulibacter sp. S0825]MCK0109982.1 hypothetical protein [Flavobacteriaceae bacterium S0825]NIX65611.1 hypothetical protein [Gaetbulibacter sp. S0825]